MAYREPAVRVTQEFANALPALATFALPHVNVGPAFQVVSKKMAGSYSGAVLSVSYPEQIAGTYVDTRAYDASDLISYPVKVFLSNVVLQTLDIAGTGEIPVDPNAPPDNPSKGGVLFTDATVGAFLNVVPGDVITLSSELRGNKGSYTVREKISNNTVRTVESFPQAESALNYKITRAVQSVLGDVDITSATGVSINGDGISLPVGLTCALDTFGACPVAAADVLVSYRAQRIEKSSDVWAYKKVSELQADFGLDQIVPENPAVFAAYISLQTASVETNLLALNHSFLEDEMIAYQSAFDVLALTEMYAISVLTHNTSVHLALKSHCETLSQSNNRLERIGIANRKLVTTAVVVDTVLTSGSEGFAGTNNLVLTSSLSSFLTDGVVPGHYIVVTSPSAVKGRYKIDSVDSQTQVTVVGPVASAHTAISFYVEKDLQKNQQAGVLAAYGHSIGSRRMVFVWPDVVLGPVGSSIRQLPGYFLGATVGALTTGLPTQQGLTNLSVSYFSGLRHSTKYFDRDQMNIIAGGGVMIFVQDVLDVTALYVRHQLTTDTSAIKFQEYSITKNVDFIAKFIRDNHKQYIGQYNIVDTTFDDLKSNAVGLMKFLKERTRLPKIGGVINSGQLTSIAQDPVNIDSIIETYQIDIPIPLNNLDITIIV